MLPIYLLLAAAGGYLLGSIPFGLVITRAAGLGDIRNIGSGNIGATNVLRTGRKDLALATLVLDAGKAAIALLLARWLARESPQQTEIELMAGAFAFIGHYSGAGDAIQVKVSTERHNEDPAFKPLFGTDRVTLTLRGRENGNMVDFEGSALQMPGVAFTAILTRISD